MNTGFTLIELLVVVLIIGILTAVALPQYNKTVEKSKTTQALTLLKTTFNAAERYYLENNVWPTSFEQLDIDIPWTGNVQWDNASMATDTRSNADWSLQLYTQTSGCAANGANCQIFGVKMGRTTGPYQGAGFIIFENESEYNWVPLRTIICQEGGRGIKFNKQEGDYCKKIMKGTSFPARKTWFQF